MMHRTTWVRRGIAEMAVAAPLALAPMLPRTMHAAEAGVATPGGAWSGWWPPKTSSRARPA
jgi:hypothetical protein